MAISSKPSTSTFSTGIRKIRLNINASNCTECVSTVRIAWQTAAVKRRAQKYFTAQLYE